MTSLERIQNFLNIEIDNRRLRNGKKKHNKNCYYYYKDLYYIVKLTKDHWMIAEDNNKTRQLLRYIIGILRHMVMSKRVLCIGIKDVYNMRTG